MQTNEAKIRIHKAVNDLIDTYFSKSTVSEKLINATLKAMAKANVNKIDKALALFADEVGNIDMQSIMSEYSNAIGDDGIHFDLRDFVKNDLVSSMLPDKFIIIRKEDLMKILQ